MTPKEKAQELYSKFYYIIPSNEMAKDEEASKKCALIAVDEISNELTSRGILSGFWYEVKQEIEKL